MKDLVGVYKSVYLAGTSPGGVVPSSHCIKQLSKSQCMLFCVYIQLYGGKQNERLFEIRTDYYYTQSRGVIVKAGQGLYGFVAESGLLKSQISLETF